MEPTSLALSAPVIAKPRIQTLAEFTRECIAAASAPSTSRPGAKDLDIEALKREWIATAETEPVVRLQVTDLEIAEDLPFTESDRAFFAEGEKLASKEQSIDDFVDLAGEKLSFWQRFWRR